ncbi:MAG TPA: hypothetical protein VMQ44_01850, partial [Candidatus Saccharimonadales bacterium]|nr:hypothetical protein [Candidatus Saccharimonadales bacterium]
MSNSSGRIIGIRHRIKQTADNESRPTQLAIHVDGKVQLIDLKDEQAELDFVFSTLKSGDTVVSALGGSGDNLAFVASRRLDELGGGVFRVPPHVLKDFRGDGDKDDDAKRLVELFTTQPSRFYRVEAKDRNLIRVRELYRLLEATMKDRIACEQRIRQLSNGQVFCSEEGGYPEGGLEKVFDELKANDAGFLALEAQEKGIEKRLKLALNELPIYTQVLSQVTGIGPRIAARVISVVGDVRLFTVTSDEAEMARLYDIYTPIEKQYYLPIFDDIESQFTDGMTIVEKLGVAIRRHRRLGHDEATGQLRLAIEAHKERSKLRYKARQRSQAKLRAFMGVHLVWDEDHQKWAFPRKRRGFRCNWSPTGRQAMYLVGDQFNRRPGTQWGDKLRANKANYRVIHPEPIVEDGKKRY